MHLRDGTLTLSATDLARHLGCEYLTQLNRQAAEGKLTKPRWSDPVLEALIERGKRHEAEYEAHLKARGLTVINLDGSRDKARVADLMRQGVDVIAQARLAGDGFFGYADFLIKVHTPSDLGPWSYEVTDTKLATETKAGTILQLSLYSELVGEIQGRTPEYMYVVRPGTNFKPDPFRVEEYGAYYRLVRRWLLDAITTPDDSLYPLPCAECAVCDWQGTCRDRWRAGRPPDPGGRDDGAAGRRVRAPGDHDAGTAGVDPGAAAGTARPRCHGDVRAAPGTGPGAARRPADRPPGPRAAADRGKARVLPAAGAESRPTCSSISRRPASMRTAAWSTCSAGA